MNEADILTHKAINHQPEAAITSVKPDFGVILNKSK